MKKNLQMQYHQLFNVIIFILVGKIVFHIGVKWLEILLILFTSVFLEVSLNYLKNKQWTFKPSPIISALAICVILRSTQTWHYALAGGLGIIFKYVLRQKDGTHYFNPSNLGVLIVLLIFPDETMLDFKGWGSHPAFLLFIFSTAVLLLRKSKLFRNSLVFFITYSSFYLLLVSSAPSSVMTSLLSPTILLFGFFIINDPQSSPRKREFLYSRTLFTTLLFFTLMLVLGKKSLNLPVSLALGSAIFRTLDLKWKDKRFFVPVYLTGVAILVFGLYFSPYNLKRNLSISNMSNYRLDDIPHPANDHIPSQSSDSLEIDAHHLNGFQRVDELIYERTLTKNTTTDFEFSKASLNEIARHESPTKPHQWGNDFAYYAGVGAIDINNDYLIDIFLTYSTGRSELFLNKGDHNFSRVTDQVFEEVPIGIETFKVADFNSDGYEDIIVIFEQHTSQKDNGIYFFDSGTKKFIFTPIKDLGKNKKQSGDIAIYDLNKDGVLDFYISFGVDWYSSEPYYPRFRDEIWISAGEGQWLEKSEEMLPEFLNKSPLAGMSTQFTQLFADGRLFLLLGNDFLSDPSLILEYKDQKFEMIDNSKYPLQSGSSMSFVSVDLNNDGIAEIWENAVQNNSTFTHADQKKVSEKGIASHQYINEMHQLLKSAAFNKVNCKEYSDPFVISKCHFIFNQKHSQINNRQDDCNDTQNQADKYECLLMSKTFNQYDFNRPDLNRKSVEEFPKVQTGNTLLQWRDGKLKSVLNHEARNTGWAWSSYPYDLNNDGLLDFYVTSNLSHYYQGSNYLLVNKSKQDEFNLEKYEEKNKVNYAGEYRGVLINDLNNDCSGDIVVNNFLYNPLYLRNKMSGSCIKVDLRGDYNNLFAIGAIAKLKLTNGEVLLREISLGGVWGSSQAKTLHFGLSKNQEIDKLEIIWPDSSRSSYTELELNKHYVIFKTSKELRFYETATEFKKISKQAYDCFLGIAKNIDSCNEFNCPQNQEMGYESKRIYRDKGQCLIETSYGDAREVCRVDINNRKLMKTMIYSIIGPQLSDKKQLEADRMILEACKQF